MPGKSGKQRSRRKPPEEWAIRGRKPVAEPRSRRKPPEEWAIRGRKPVAEPRPRPGNAARPYAVTMICTLEEREAIIVAATESGMSLSGYLRAILWPPEPEEPAA